jgi:hypothetical protein
VDARCRGGSAVHPARTLAAPELRGPAPQGPPEWGNWVVAVRLHPKAWNPPLLAQQATHLNGMMGSPPCACTHSKILGSHLFFLRR